MSDNPMDARDFMRGWIEQQAIEARPDHDGQIRLSIAISLKRIADALERIADALEGGVAALSEEGGGNGDGPPEPGGGG